jgi:hypothetical protein
MKTDDQKAAECLDAFKPLADAAKKVGHTPGPWSVIGDKIRRTDQGDLYIAISTSDLTLDFIAPRAMKAQHMANARLVAASPTMYEFIKSLAEKGDKDAAAIIANI